jgi:hypothetical protein
VVGVGCLGYVEGRVVCVEAASFGTGGAVDLTPAYFNTVFVEWEAPQGEKRRGRRLRLKGGQGRQNRGDHRTTTVCQQTPTCRVFNITFSGKQFAENKLLPEKSAPEADTDERAGNSATTHAGMTAERSSGNC